MNQKERNWLQTKVYTLELLTENIDFVMKVNPNLKPHSLYSENAFLKNFIKEINEKLEVYK